MFRGCLFYATWLALILSPAFSSPAQTPEFRAMWADTFPAGLRNSTEVSQMVADARAGKFNAVIVEVRKRGDAYYNSLYEPKATDVSPQTFDPLADLIAKAHNTATGPRIEVHAWIVTYNIWNNETNLPAQTTHPYRLHPEWLTEDVNGATWESSGDNYAFDPSHPGVQQHTFNVAMDLISRYDLDGFNFDYIRYAGRNWGYHPVAVARFNARYGRSGMPAANDSAWMQFRRDQVTALVRKVYLSAIALKPQVKISADTITFAPGITSDSQWFSSSAAYTDKLQDWRGWMQEGIIDLNIPMAYFRHDDVGATYNRATDWTNWSNFAKNRRFNRHLAMGAGAYLNSTSNTIHQMRTTRVPASSGNAANGVALYSYAVPSTNSNRAQFLVALTNAPNAHDSNEVAVFEVPVPTPVMPWKTSPTLGHLKGFITNSVTGSALDGAIVTLSGPVSRVQTNDATGFYGFVDLPPGTYTLSATYSNLVGPAATPTMTVGTVTTRNIGLAPAVIGPISNIAVWPGRTAALVSWSGAIPTSSVVEYGLTTNLESVAIGDSGTATIQAALLGGLLPDTNYYFRIRSTLSGSNFVTTIDSFRTAGELIIDNPQASFTGSWTIGTSSPDKFGPDYHYAPTVAGSANATATYRPNIATPGNYEVYVWYPQGGNRSSNTPVTISSDSGSVSVTVNQSTGGGAWQLLNASKHFARGTGGFIQIANNSSDAGKVVMADAVRLVYLPTQEPPLAGTIPEWWSQFYFATNANPTLDPDGDGLSTWQEYFSGTVPTNPGSRLIFGLENPTNDFLRISFTPWRAGRDYQLEERSQVDAGSWVQAGNVSLSVTNGRGIFSVTNLDGRNRFYRLRVR